MFSEQMGYDGITKAKLERPSIFLTLFYIPLWMKANSACDVSTYDLQFYHDMINYRLIDEEVAKVVLRKLQYHRWYLTEEVVPLTLFSNILHQNSNKQLLLSSR